MLNTDLYNLNQSVTLRLVILHPPAPRYAKAGFADAELCALAADAFANAGAAQNGALQSQKRLQIRVREP